ncbi:MAG: hypothetical protein WAO76_10060 [Georgfuchsia sp.]
MNAALLGRKANYWLRYLGLPGMFGLALIAAAAVYLFAVMMPAHARSRQVEQRISEASARLQADGKTDREKTPAEQLMDFYHVFPKGTTIPDWLGKIYAIAGQQNLDLDVGEYSLTQAKSGRLDQFRITFPVKGSYPQIRQFIGAALATAPALALDSLSLKRDKVGDGYVDARIVFLLYLEKAE